MGDRERRKYKADYSQLKTKLFLELSGMVILAVVIIWVLYKLVWSHRGADLVVSMFQRYLLLDYERAVLLYHSIFRKNMEYFWMAAVIAVFLLMVRMLLNLFTRYFDIVSRGVDALLMEKGGNTAAVGNACRGEAAECGEDGIGAEDGAGAGSGTKEKRFGDVFGARYPDTADHHYRISESD